jgi:HlyD family secretion protein
MKRFILPTIGLLAALWATFSIARTTPYHQRTDPPGAPPRSAFSDRVAAVGLVEASTENIAIGTPLSGVVTKVFVTAGETVKKGQALFQIDTRQLEADLAVEQGDLDVARTRVAVAKAHLADLTHQLEFVERVTDKRAVSEEEISRRRAAVDTAAAELAAAEVQVGASESHVRAIETAIERSTIRAPLATEVLQVKIRVGEFAAAAPAASPLMLLGRSRPLHVRVDVDEHEGWRVGPGARAIAQLRGNAHLATPLTFVRFEPFVVPKMSLTGASNERVDTRVLQVIYRVDRDDLPVFVGQQMDVFIEASPLQGGEQ